MNAASDVIVLGFDIANDKIFVGHRNLTANAFTKGDCDVIRRVTGESSQMQGLGIVIGKIKSHPIVVSNFRLEKLANLMQSFLD